jgi:hypothetical protein
MAKANTKSTRQSAKAQVQQAAPVVQMCVLPEANLRAVYDWLESPKMSMPHNEVVQCLKLLGVAQILKDKT